jgi:hypothetical protein
MAEQLSLQFLDNLCAEMRKLHGPGVTSAIRRLSREGAAAPVEIGIARVKAAAKNVPAWVTVVAGISFAAVAVLFFHSSELFERSAHPCKSPGIKAGQCRDGRRKAQGWLSRVYPASA